MPERSASRQPSSLPRTPDTINTTYVPIVFVPGIMGSRLRIDDWDWDPDDGLEMLRKWLARSVDKCRRHLSVKEYPDATVLQELSNFRLPGRQNAKRAISKDAHLKDLAEREKLDPVALYEARGWGGLAWDPYGPVLRDLEVAFNHPSQSPGGRHPVYAFGYDWRQRNENSAGGLARRVDDVLRREQGATQVILVTHSMGGLVARHACKMGGLADRVLGAVYNAQPFHGAIAAYRRFFTGCTPDYNDGDIPFTMILGNEWWKYAAQLSGVPGAMQLLPTHRYHAQVPATTPLPESTPQWLITSPVVDLATIYAVYAGTSEPGILRPATQLPRKVDSEIKRIWDSDIVPQLRDGISVAQAFHKDLENEDRPPVYVVYSNGLTTDEWTNWAAPEDRRYRQTDTGDGTVPSLSAAGRGLPAVKDRTMMHGHDHLGHAEVFKSPAFREQVRRYVRGILNHGVVPPGGVGGAGGAQPAIEPKILLAGNVVLVKKPHMSPARVSVKLSTATPFDGEGTLTCSKSKALRFFTAAQGGKEIRFVDRDNVFPGRALTAGVELFVEGAAASSSLDDVVLILTLDKGSGLNGLPAKAKLTVVELTLDICETRAPGGGDPPPLPQPPAQPGPDPSDKVSLGRGLAVQDADKTHERAMLIVRQPKPATFAGKLALARANDKVQAFKVEDPKHAGGPIADREVFEAKTVPAGGLRFFVEGMKASGEPRDTGYRLGIDGVDDQGDRVAITAIDLKIELAAGGPPPKPLLLFVKRAPLQLKAIASPAGGKFSWRTSGPAGAAIIDGRSDAPEVTLRADAISVKLDDAGIFVAYRIGKGDPEASLKLTALRVHLDVDADRDGVVEPDGAGKSDWNFGASSQGAVIIANCDDDGPPKGRDNENDVVDTEKDVDDLAPLVIRASGPLPAGFSLKLRTDLPKRVRVFDKRAAKAALVLGPPDTKEWTLPSASAERILGMEATSFPVEGFNGLISFSLVLTDGSGTEKARDGVKVRVAPWLMTHHLEPGEQVYVVKTQDNEAFRAALGAALSATGLPPPHEVTVSGPEDDRWMQDCMEFGYTRMPKKTLPVVLNAPRGRPLQGFAEAKLQGPDFGWTFHGQHEENTFNSFGNLEVTPPLRAAGKEWKFGRIYFGHGRGHSEGPINPALRAFLEAQGAQSPVEIDSSWLYVGHVDEMMTFVPASGDPQFRLVLASPRKAIGLMEKARDAGHGGARLCTNKQEQITIDDFLGPVGTRSAHRKFNEDVCQKRLNDVRGQVALDPSKFGLSDADIVELPVLFHNEGGGKAGAFTADIVNMLLVGTHCIMPDPFGPIVGGQDLFRQEADSVLRALGCTTHYVDDYDTYHLALGEVHCGTNTRRRPPSTPWWEQAP